MDEVIQKPRGLFGCIEGWSAPRSGDAEVGAHHASTLSAVRYGVKRTNGVQIVHVPPCRVGAYVSVSSNFGADDSGAHIETDHCGTR